MTNYSINPGHVRVDFFKPGGKWYMTERIDMSRFYHSRSFYDQGMSGVGGPLHNAVDAAGYTQFQGTWVISRKQFITVVLEPYHDLSHPIILMPADPYDPGPFLNESGQVVTHI